MSGFHAYTFNAAGLHPDTAYNNQNLSNAAHLIDVYKVDYDIFTWVQENAMAALFLFELISVPDAIGTEHWIDGLYDLEYNGALLNGPPLFAGETPSSLYFRYLCHLMDQVIYGMEKEIFNQ